MPRYRVVFGLLTVFALLNTLLLGLQLLRILHFTSAPSQGPHGTVPVIVNLPLAILQSHSIELTSLSWGIAFGIWIWRGKVKSRWVRHGLDQDSFRLLLQMKGSQTRTTILKALLTPRDRFQLAKDLDLDWATVDYHVQILLKHSLITEKIAFGNVKFYELTLTGSILLAALDELNKKDKAV